MADKRQEMKLSLIEILMRTDTKVRAERRGVLQVCMVAPSFGSLVSELLFPERFWTEVPNAENVIHAFFADEMERIRDSVPVAVQPPFDEKRIEDCTVKTVDGSACQKWSQQEVQYDTVCFKGRDDFFDRNPIESHQVSDKEEVAGENAAQQEAQWKRFQYGIHWCVLFGVPLAKGGCQ